MGKECNKISCSLFSLAASASWSSPVYYNIPDRYIIIYRFGMLQYTKPVYYHIPHRYTTIYRTGIRPYSTSVYDRIPYRYTTIYQIGIRPYTDCVIMQCNATAGLRFVWGILGNFGGFWLCC